MDWDQWWNNWNTGHKEKIVQFSTVQLLSRVWLFATPWTAAGQASLSITNSQSLLKLMSIESVIPSNHLFCCLPLQLSDFYQFSSVAQSCPTLCDPMNHSTSGLPVHHQLPEFTKLTSIELVMPSNHLIFCCPLLLLPSIFPRIRVFSNESALHIRW